MKVHLSIELPDNRFEEILNLLLQFEKTDRENIHLHLDATDTKEMTAEEFTKMISRIRPDIPTLYYRTIPNEKA